MLFLLDDVVGQDHGRAFVAERRDDPLPEGLDAYSHVLIDEAEVNYSAPLV